jgi:hypothetical protein
MSGCACLFSRRCATSVMSERQSVHSLRIDGGIDGGDDANDNHSIRYTSYSMKSEPRLWDWIIYMPLNLVHFFQNLASAFGWRFVFMVCAVYGIQQGEILMIFFCCQQKSGRTCKCMVFPSSRLLLERCRRNLSCRSAGIYCCCTHTME